jgi:hypothetical protein
VGWEIRGTVVDAVLEAQVFDGAALLRPACDSKDAPEKILPICENASELVAAAALLLDGWASHRAVRTENAAVARLRFEQRFTVRALVKILACARGHHLLPRVAAARAGEHGLQDNGTHGFAMSFDGNPASVVAWVNRAVVALSGSNVTVAVFLSKSTAVALTPGTRSSAFLTTIGQVPQVIFSTVNVAVCGGAAKVTPAASNVHNSGRETRVDRRMVFSFKSRVTGRTTGMR